VYNRQKGTWADVEPNVTYRVVGNAFTLVEGGDGFSMFRGARIVNNAICTDYLVLAEYAKAFGKGADGVPHLASDKSPLALLKDYPIRYENPTGSGRIYVHNK